MGATRVYLLFTVGLLILVGQAEIGWTGRKEIKKQSPSAVTETLRVMGKEVDHIVAGEEPMYVVPAITRITSLYGTSIDLNRLRTPCLAEVTYSNWWKGTDKLPVVLHLKVKKVYPGASSVESQE